VEPLAHSQVKNRLSLAKMTFAKDVLLSAVENANAIKTELVSLAILLDHPSQRFWVTLES